MALDPEASGTLSHRFGEWYNEDGTSHGALNQRRDPMEERTRNNIHNQMQSLSAALPMMNADELKRIEWTLRLLLLVLRDFHALADRKG